MAVVDKEVLKKMKPGETLIVNWEHPREFRCMQTKCSDVSLNFPELNLRLSTKLNRTEKTITITAHEFAPAKSGRKIS